MEIMTINGARWGDNHLSMQTRPCALLGLYCETLVN